MSTNEYQNYVKILFEIARDDGDIELETVWATVESEGYKIDNIPFYARGFAWGDIVSATPDADGLLRCTGLITPSGHSTVRLWFADELHVSAVRSDLHKMNCGTEVDLGRLVAVDIPSTISYDNIRTYLNEKELVGIFEYEEACLAAGHA